MRPTSHGRDDPRSRRPARSLLEPASRRRGRQLARGPRARGRDTHRAISSSRHERPVGSPTDLEESVGLLDEYERLFVGPGQVPCPPYESFWREDVPVDIRRTLMGPCTAELRGLYQELGLEISSGKRRAARSRRRRARGPRLRVVARRRPSRSPASSSRTSAIGCRGCAGRSPKTPSTPSTVTSPLSRSTGWRRSRATSPLPTRTDARPRGAARPTLRDLGCAPSPLALGELMVRLRREHPGTAVLVVPELCQSAKSIVAALCANEPQCVVVGCRGDYAKRAEVLERPSKTWPAQGKGRRRRPAPAEGCSEQVALEQSVDPVTGFAGARGGERRQRAGAGADKSVEGRTLSPGSARRPCSRAPFDRRLAT